MCGCRKVATRPNGLQRTASPPTVTPIKVTVKNVGTTPIAYFGARTGVSYGEQKDGNQLVVWKADMLEDPEHLEEVTS